MARSSLEGVDKESMKRSAIAFTDSDSLANTVKNDEGQSYDNRFSRCVHAPLLPTHLHKSPIP